MRLKRSLYLNKSKVIYLESSNPIPIHKRVFQLGLLSALRRLRHIICALTFQDIVRSLKTKLDEKYGRLWHAFIVKGQYHAFYSYEGGNSFAFKKGPRIYIIYKTPAVQSSGVLDPQ